MEKICDNCKHCFIDGSPCDTCLYPELANFTPKEEKLTQFIIKDCMNLAETTNSHYKNCFDGCNDVDDYCKKNNTNFFIGNILKAAVRLDKKYNGQDAIKDLNKIIHYAKKEIDRRGK